MPETGRNQPQKGRILGRHTVRGVLRSQLL